METKNSKDRRLIAVAVLIFSSLLLISISVSFIMSGGEQGNAGIASEKVFATMIPLIGTWVGTVIAYYFSGENFQKATDSVSRIASQVIEERLSTTKAIETMIPINISTIINLSSSDKLGTGVNLRDQVINLFSDRITRLPILDEDSRVKYILHESVVYNFISTLAIDYSDKTEQFDINDLTLSDLLNHKDNKGFASRTVGFVDKDASLSDVKREMESLRKCQDIFVTEDGTSSGQTLGWITNVILSRYSRAS